MLDKILDWRNLCAAWEQVADNRGAPGIDGVSIQRFRRQWEANLRRLQDQVWAGKYRPGKLRRVGIPKRGGGQRLLQIPNVADRVLQRATLNMCERIFEAKFMACSYAYRPNRGLRQAVTAILAYRDQGYTFVLDADIDACFDSLDHNLLRGLLEAPVADYRVRELIDQWLLAGRRSQQPDRGIALGMPISPLLCNIYLHELDKALVRDRWPLVRYADDFVVCCDSEARAQQAYAATGEMLRRLKLSYEPTKTMLTSFDTGFEFLGVRFYRHTYEFTWLDKQVAVKGPIPRWLWGYVPDGYEWRS